MSDFGIQIYNAFGTKVLDSLESYGGVCLGLITVPFTNNDYTINFTTQTEVKGGIAICTKPGAFIYTADVSLGYLRFIFNARYTQGQSAALFAI